MSVLPIKLSDFIYDIIYKLQGYYLLKDNCEPMDTTKSFGETVRGIREMDLNDKLFRLKNVEGLQDTEANQDDSELKVRRYYYQLDQHNTIYDFNSNITMYLSFIYS